MQFSWPGWRWHATWNEVRHQILDLVGGGTWHGWRWDSNPVTWIQMIQMRKITSIWGPRCKRGMYWMEGRRTFWDLQVFVTGPESWDAILMNRKELIHSRDWGEMQMSGHGWRWNATWMAVRCNYRGLGGGETGCGWRWYSYFDLYGDEVEPEWRLAAHD